MAEEKKETKQPEPKATKPEPTVTAKKLKVLHTVMFKGIEHQPDEKDGEGRSKFYDPTYFNYASKQESEKDPNAASKNGARTVEQLVANGALAWVEVEVAGQPKK